jgi:hypothetical protein
MVEFEILRECSRPIDVGDGDFGPSLEVDFGNFIASWIDVFLVVRRMFRYFVSWAGGKGVVDAR